MVNVNLVIKFDTNNFSTISKKRKVGKFVRGKE
jgi:hypothetical protein